MMNGDESGTDRAKRQYKALQAIAVAALVECVDEPLVWTAQYLDKEDKLPSLMVK